MNDPNSCSKLEKTGNDILISISSMTLRCAIRLFAPMLVLVLLTVFATYYLPWGNIDHSAPNIFTHLHKFWLRSVEVMDPYYWEVKKPLPPHFQQAWTLSVEYRLSLALFLMLATTATLSTMARKTAAVLVSFWAVYASRRWEIVAAMGGMVLAELRSAPFLDDISRLFNRPRGYLRPKNI
ncbi:hypothetical protein CIB48_g11314 [Xylaria polymorpha]|nr:hypothetical protein CIB48_g11314 [Xylaria polymorpha]